MAQPAALSDEATLGQLREWNAYGSLGPDVSLLE